MQVKKQQLEPDMEQWTGSKLQKEYIEAVLLCLSLLFFSQLFVRLPQTTILPFFISFFLGMVLITASYLFLYRRQREADIKISSGNFYWAQQKASKMLKHSLSILPLPPLDNLVVLFFSFLEGG